MESDTSSDLNVNYIDNKGNNINLGGINAVKKESSETDHYLNMLANTVKTAQESEEEESSLKLDDFKNDSSSVNSSSVSSKPEFTNLDFNNSEENRSNNSSTRSKKSKRSKRSKITELSESSNNSSENNSTRSSIKSPIKVQLTEKEIKMKKIEMLRKLSELKQKGYKLTKEYDFNSSLEDMEYEYALLKSFADKRNGIKLYKNILLNACSVTEFLNDKYDPFSFQLAGWSEHMSVEVDSYDDVLEEIYEKYKGRGKSMPPEMKLLLLVMASASAFHFSKAHLSNIPGLDSVLKNNPDMISKLVSGQRQTSQFMTEQEINIENQRKDLQERERRLKQQMAFQQQQMAKQPQQQQMVQPNINTTSFPLNNTPLANNESYTNAHHPSSLNPGLPNPLIGQKTNITASQSVNDVLSKLNTNSADTQEESSVNNDRIISDSASEKRRGRKKKSLMQIN